jgi:hypothetical protein
MNRYEVEVDITPEEEAYLAEIDSSDEEPVLDEEWATEEWESEPWAEATPRACRHCGETSVDDEMAVPAEEAQIFADDEVYEEAEHALHDAAADVPFDEAIDGEAGVEDEASLAERVQAALRQGFWAVAIRMMIAAGERDENKLTNLVFQARHPELRGRKLRPDEKALTADWMAVRNQIVRPLLPAGRGGPRPAVLSSGAIRAAWREYLNAADRMVRLRMFGRWNTPVNPETPDAWRALERALTGAGYTVHRAWVFNPRAIGSTSTPSLHAYGLAIDIDHGELVAGSPVRCNINRRTPDTRLVRFSPAATKEERCRDVHRGVADTSFTPAQVAAVEAIRTVDGHQVFTWGGRWRTTKDTMHFQINVTPEELRRGLR